VFAAFCVVYKENPGGSAAGGTAAGGGSGGGFFAGMRALATNRQYMLQCLCYSCMAGVSFGIPAFLATAFHAIGLTEKESAWTNLAFIGTGVVVGLLAGKLCTNPRTYPRVLKGAAPVNIDPSSVPF
jgi:hypothetical protein